MKKVYNNIRSMLDKQGWYSFWTCVAYLAGMIGFGLGIKFVNEIEPKTVSSSLVEFYLAIGQLACFLLLMRTIIKHKE
jgi:hypothetical protein